MARRTPHDLLREEYFQLLPEIRRVVDEIEATVRHRLLPLSRELAKHERIAVVSRVKDCESAIVRLNKDRDKAKEGGLDVGQAGSYKLTSLPDLAAVRVLAFLRRRWRQVDEELRELFPSWEAKPVPGINEGDEPLSFKYFGLCDASDRITGEVQATPMLIGRFWEIEHSALYKGPATLGKRGEKLLKEKRNEVISALIAFDAKFEELTSVVDPAADAEP